MLQKDEPGYDNIFPIFPVSESVKHAEFDFCLVFPVALEFIRLQPNFGGKVCNTFGCLCLGDFNITVRDARIRNRNNQFLRVENIKK